MAGPINPITLSMIGAAGGAALKPNNPLQGALLGATAGYTGGTALGVGAPAAASGGGLTMGAGGVTGLTSGTGAALNAGANTANAGLYGLGGTGTTAGLSAVPASTALIDPVAMGQREALIGGNYSLSSSAAAPSMANYSLVAPSAVTSAPSKSFMDSISMSGKNAYENPMMAGSALIATQGLLTPEQMNQAPAMPLQAGRGVKPYDFVAAMNPYQESVISSPQISLLG
jgi:hypothetical protein